MPGAEALLRRVAEVQAQTMVLVVELCQLYIISMCKEVERNMHLTGLLILVGRYK